MSKVLETPELLTMIFAAIADSAKTANNSCHPGSLEKDAKAMVVGLSPVMRVNRQFASVARRVLSDQNDGGIIAKNKILELSKFQELELFTSGFQDLICNTQDIEIPFTSLLQWQKKVVLQELSTKDNLKKLLNVKLSMGALMVQAAYDANRTLLNHVLNVVSSMSKHGRKGLNISLDLSANRLGNVGAQAIAEMLPQCSALTELDLRDNGLSDSLGPVHNNGLLNFINALSTSQLNKLNLGNTSNNRDARQNNILDMAGGKRLADVLPNTELRHLHLSKVTGMADSAKRCIINALPKCQKLTFLAWNGSGTGGIRRVISNLVTTLPETSITHLDLSNNDIPSDGVKAIVEAMAMPRSKLAYLDISQNKDSPEAWSEILTTLPANYNGTSTQPGRAYCQIVTKINSN